MDVGHLVFYAHTFVPLLEKLQKNRATSKKENRLYEAKMLDNIISQLWELWPVFCKKAIDKPQGFPVLGTSFNFPFCFVSVTL
jgi:hypothetical protein